METKEIAEIIFNTPKWYASIPSRISIGFMDAQTGNRIKARYKRGVLSFEMMELIFNHHGYFITDKTWKKQ